MSSSHPPPPPPPPLPTTTTTTTTTSTTATATATAYHDLGDQKNNLHVGPSPPSNGNAETPATMSEQSSIRLADEKQRQQDDGAVEVGLSGDDDDDDAGNASQAALPISQLIFVVVALVLGIFMVALDQTIVATAIPKITDQFHGLDVVGWYGSAFFLTLASFQSTWGKVYKYFPLKISFLLSMFIFEVGSLICAISKNSTTLIVGRAIAGVGGAGIASGSYTIIAFAATPAQRPAFTGILGAAYGIASVAGPLLGGVFTERVSWRWCFYINLPFGGISAAIIFLCFTTPGAAAPVKATWKEKILNMDLIGTFIIMAAAICYLLALQWGGVTKEWSSGSVIATLVIFIILVIVFVVAEWWQGDRAVLVGRLLRNRTILIASIYAFFLGGAFFTLLYYIPIYFQAIRDVKAGESGVRNLALILATSIFTVLSGGLITMTGHFVPFLIGGGVLSTIGAGLIFTLGLNSPPSMWIGYQILAGIGIGLSIQVPIIAAQAMVEPVDISSITAMILFFQTIGGAFFVSAGQSVFTNYIITTLATNAPSVSAAEVIATGATEIRNVFSADQIPGVLNSYLSGLHAAFALSIVAAGLATIAGVFSEWRTIKASSAQGG